MEADYIPFESQPSREDEKFSALLASLEMILGGTTSFLDAGGIHMEEAAGVYAKAGLRGGVSSMTGDSEGLPRTYGSVRKKLSGGLKNCSKPFAVWEGKAAGLFIP